VSTGYKTVCPMCHGRGAVSTVPGFFDASPCPVCSGAGSLPAPEAHHLSDPLTEESLDAAVKVVLQHKLVNIVNSILKQSSLQDLITERVRPLWQRVDGR
jgi:hypothetical protein